MSDFRVGFCRMAVNPPDGIYVRGYFRKRYSEGILDDIEIVSMALSSREVTALVISMDICGFYGSAATTLSAVVAEATGLAPENIFLHATHTHTGPLVGEDAEYVTDIERAYFAFIKEKIVEAARKALDDRQPARMGHAVAAAPKLAFIRRYRMKDGSVQTNPGVGNPDIAGPIGQPDHRVNVLRFDRADGRTVLLVNYGNHPDTISGCRLSADWPGFLRRSLESIVPNCSCIFLNGAEGDVNHINVDLKPGEFSHIGPQGGEARYAWSRYMGQSLACAVLQVLGSIETAEVTSLKCLQRHIQVPANLPAPEELPEAHRIYSLYQQGRLDELASSPRYGSDMQRVTMIAKAKRMVKLENGPEYFDMILHGIAVDDAVLVGIPGEPFTGIGLGLKDTADWNIVLPVCNTGVAMGYFPMQDAYDEGGYEAGVSRYKAGVAELMIREGRRLMEDLK